MFTTESLAVIAEGVHHARSDGTPNLGSERMSLCQGARARLMLGEYEEAQDLLTSVFQTPIEVRARPLVDRVSQIGIAAGSTSSGGRVTSDIALGCTRFRVTKESYR